MNPTGELLEFRSPVDGLLHPCAVCATDDSSEPKPLIVEVSPGALNDLRGALALTEEIAGIAAAAGRSCVVLRPTGRGPGSVYQDYGEVDVLEAIEFVASRHAIDRDRITVTGASMGGAATWYLLSHYPDWFAAGAPFCGYADYRLWEKPGGLTFPMRPWEEPSWRARSAAMLAENLAGTPLWIVHGEWDRAVGGGVSVEHSREMARLLGEVGGTYRYTELPRTGHDSRQPEIWREVVLWLLDRRRDRDPEHVSLVTASLRHNTSAWLRIDQLSRYGERGGLEGWLRTDGTVRIATANVRTFTVGPVPDGAGARLTVVPDDQAAGDLEPGQRNSYRREAGGAWQTSAFESSPEKRHGSSGPIGDLFFDRTTLVPGTTGGEDATFFNDWVARDAATFYRTRNGGVHRGGIMGVNTVELPVVRDVDLDEATRTDSNLLLYGTTTSNAVMARYAEGLPIAFGPGVVRLADREWRHPRVAAIAIFPHPENAQRYVAVHGGPAADAVTWGSHLDMALLPDYLVYAGGEILDWGFWGNDWRSQST